MIKSFYNISTQRVSKMFVNFGNLGLGIDCMAIENKWLQFWRFRCPYFIATTVKALTDSTLNTKLLEYMEAFDSLVRLNSSSNENGMDVTSSVCCPSEGSVDAITVRRLCNSLYRFLVFISDWSVSSKILSLGTTSQLCFNMSFLFIMRFFKNEMVWSIRVKCDDMLEMMANTSAQLSWQQINNLSKYLKDFTWG